ncbi:acyl-CoA desaturase [Actinophytocola sp.]|uniref:fatty acid desaturase family protein n=1 Tax=Actinophytocola sp. TaxID=1872138 RepID=UPI002D7FCD0C|nr:acyl-CoA desaturase [Actinophytocola sp.]HET9139833.1 acyl-CoA desaturase [Actinophytocola sp.]
MRITVAPTADFAELAEEVRAAGLLEPRRAYYTAKIVFNLLLTAGCWTAFALAGDSPWQLAVAVALGFVLLQAGFLGHDAGHRQITRSKRAAEVLGLIHLNLLLGAANGWWVAHHNRHHSDPNNLDRDPDTLRRPVAFDVSELPAKGRTPARRFLIRFQAVLFFVLLGNEAWRVRAAGFTAARAGLLRNPVLELGLVIVHIGLFAGAVFLVLPPGLALAFVAVSQLTLGLGLGAVFAPNHKGMPVYRDGEHLDWLHRQVLTSRNIRAGRLVDFLFGGLNHQIEHHLFPGMPRVNLRRARPIVRDYCARHAIPYREVSLWSSYRAVAAHLGAVSRQARQ